VDKDNIRKVKRSYARCFIGEKNLIDGFYEIFLNSNSDIATMFKNTDFFQQKLLLRQGINCMIMFTEGVFAGNFCLEEIKISHNKKHINIHPSYYPYWKNSLLSALEKYDSQFDEELRLLWIETIDKGVKFIANGY
jgi:hemoglobin-like flavoprotein